MQTDPSETVPSHPSETVPVGRSPGRTSSVLGGGGIRATLGILLLFVLAWGALNWLTKPYDGVHLPPAPAPLEVTPYAPEVEVVGSAVEPPPWDSSGPATQRAGEGSAVAPGAPDDVAVETVSPE